MKILYLFPDTNVFLQCRPLDQVAWSAFGDWDRIEVLLTRPVQTEIDALKGKGNGRQASRARTASSRVRELLQAEGDRLTLREQPLVQLCLRHDLRRDESASGDLNYEERDDQLVGIALGFQKANPDAEVWLLTNDTGPMASAKAVGLKYHEVPEEWFLSPEVEDSEKRENALKVEIARYKSLEPSFVVELLSTSEERLQASLTMYRALSVTEREQLLSRLTTKYPLCADFGPSESQERTRERSAASLLFGQAKEVFQPATSDEIDQYREAYAKWEHECVERLSNLHKTLHARLIWPQLTVRIENVGTRPADDALVVIDVQGNIFLRPPKRNEEGKDDGKENLRLSPAPSAPKGRWKGSDFWGVGSMYHDLARALKVSQPGHLATFIPHIATHHRDPNALYFKEGGRGQVSKHIEYECAQWRHAQSAEDFEFDVLCSLQPGIHAASVRVEVHAANLTYPEVAQLPIRLSVEESSCLGVAQQMVAALGA